MVLDCFDEILLFSQQVIVLSKYDHGMDRLPPEIFWQIFRYFEDDDILNLPYSWVIFGLADGREMDRFQEIKAPPSRSGFQRLSRIADHPVIAPRVKTLVFCSWETIESSEGEHLRDKFTAPQQLPQGRTFENDFGFSHKFFRNQGEDARWVKCIFKKLENMKSILIGDGDDASDLINLRFGPFLITTSMGLLGNEITYFLPIMVQAARSLYCF